MGVSKNRGTPKWMVKIMENPIKMDDLGVPLFLETPKSLCEGIALVVVVGLFPNLDLFGSPTVLDSYFSLI